MKKAYPIRQIRLQLMLLHPPILLAGDSPVMKIRVLLIGLIAAAMIPMIAYSQITGTETTGVAPEIDACRASGLIALKERSPAIKDVTLDLDSVRLVKMTGSKIGNVEIKAIVLGEVNIEKNKSSKPQDFICILGDKGNVLLTIFSNKTSTEAD
jgi:hypothetical protein